MMDNFVASFTHPVLAMGQAAEELVGKQVQGQCDGRVEAVFASTFYIASGGQLICLGHAGLEPGPLNCVTAAPAAIDWQASGLTPGTKARISRDAIRVGSAFRFPLADSRRWQPVPRPLPVATRVSRGIALFRHAISERHDIDGLGHFLVEGFTAAPNQHICRAAARPLNDARRWLARAFRAPRSIPREETAWIEKLCGLGPGLTPSGDDFMGGMLIALNFLDRAQLKTLLWHRIEREVRDHGNPISLAHLAAAARGLEGATIHRVVSAITGGCSEQIALTVDGLSGIGHSSGWDIMTGVITTLDAWLESQTLNGTH